MNRKFMVSTLTALISTAFIIPSAVYADWSTDEKGRIFYYTEDGNYLIGEQDIDGEKYLFSANGVLKTGWRTVGGQRKYYDPETGKSITGWFEYCGKNYYIDSESGKATGYFKDSDGLPHIMSEKGDTITETGFKEIDNNSYYILSDGTLATGKTVIQDDTYFFDDDGKMSTGVVIAGSGEGYLFGNDGKMLTGWQDYNDKKYYLADDGAMCFSSWQTIDDSKYYFSADGAMVSGINEIDGKKYYFADDGKMLTGWQTIGENECYFTEDGSLANGLLTLEDGTYYFSENGTKQSGWIVVNSHQCYFGADGKMVFGWQTIDGDEYFFNNYGIMETNTTIDGKVLGADGKVQPISAVQQKANSIIAQIGTSTEAIYNFVRNNNRYQYMEATRSQAQIEAVGWSYFANYAFNNRFVVCYYFAAITDVLYKQAGYESRIVHGTGHGTGEHYWNEIKINGNWTCIDTCNGYFQVSFSYLQSKNYTFYNYVYPTYN